MSFKAELQAYPGGTSALTSGTSIPPVPLGARARDRSGNEYMYVDYQSALAAGEWVVINSSYAASRVTSTSRGPLGIVIAAPSASDFAGWVQIYGINTAAIASSTVTSADQLYIPVTTDGGHVYNLENLTTDITSPPATSDQGNMVFGALSMSAASTATSPEGALTTPGALITVQLNYPYALGLQINFANST